MHSLIDGGFFDILHNQIMNFAILSGNLGLLQKKAERQDKALTLHPLDVHA
jgi:hypothetical protein